ncbi:metalloregulator ArsR/SmtB family transcription factor [Salmonella enterica subsp. enterica serovar Muenchen]|uniref:Helix-turn-helix transcriptional regulator n=1 Tax=Salmonella enterica subsp. enterica serovar Panama TaxID=29472 RepID=A0A619AHP6_SALET|nr:metalloregulator ArsR/SmtB family transcription factor [Salmonella enterica]EBG5027269.1 helix-turn-helix transcriptional regulator [Salmonella enterica subsp. enterica serovar Oranienburg]EBU9317052.1 transcriptional regulator [Salmonella enterica subsp. enterica serovar Amager]EBU9821204.1 transcriptional regulator [Salmonella enterica subsp. enterica serovar Newport]EBV4144020.1 transcriptional regulator [Salmonella enterica subsp. enterica serovar Benin]ECI3889868.1 transcriptional regu
MPLNSVTDLQRDIKKAAQGAADVLRCLSNDDRLLLMCQLSQGEASVAELEAATGIYQPTLSQQLSVMRRLNLVVTRREGKQIFYRIEDKRIIALLNTLYDLYCPNVAADRVKNSGN